MRTPMVHPRQARPRRSTCIARSRIPNCSPKAVPVHPTASSTGWRSGNPRSGPTMAGSFRDTLVVDIYEHWLRKDREGPPPGGTRCSTTMTIDHVHNHETGTGPIRFRAIQMPPIPTNRPHWSEQSPEGRDIWLVRKGHLHQWRTSPRNRTDGVPRLVPVLGRKVVARAWTDPELQGSPARGRAARDRATFRVQVLGLPVVPTFVQNSPTVHNVIVCTLCSCYPRGCSGCRRAGTRARSTVPARYTNRAWGFWRNSARSCRRHPPPPPEVRVHDSTADLRFMVLAVCVPPRRKHMDCGRPRRTRHARQPRRRGSATRPLVGIQSTSEREKRCASSASGDLGAGILPTGR